MTAICEFDGLRDTEFAHRAPGFERVLHIFHEGWHGIRAACGYAPGRKIAISHERGPDGEALRHIQGLVHRHRIDRIVFQGYSHNASGLAEVLRKDFGDGLRLYAVTHVTSVQFENPFEVGMQALLLTQLRAGLFRRLGSVKPGFAAVVPQTWPHTILNYAPNLGDAPTLLVAEQGHVFVPLENTWRKNLYTNILGAQAAPEVRTIHAVNNPSGLDTIADLSKLSLAPYRKRAPLLAFMGAMEAVLNVTLAECQPMTQLEALAAGAPCLTGRLGLEDFSDDPLFALTEVDRVDDPRAITVALSRVIAARRADPAEIAGMIGDHLSRRTALATRTYADFLEL